MAIHGDRDDELRLFQTGEHPCGYWSERLARDLVLDPQDRRLGGLYPLALSWGFRRSGDLVYRPHCAQCHAGHFNLCPNVEFIGAPPFDGAMANRIWVPRSQIVPIPQKFTALDAVMLEPLGVAIHAVDLGRLAGPAVPAEYERTYPEPVAAGRRLLHQ